MEDEAVDIEIVDGFSLRTNSRQDTTEPGADFGELFGKDRNRFFQDYDRAASWFLPYVASGVGKTNISAKLMALVPDKRRACCRQRSMVEDVPQWSRG